MQNFFNKLLIFFVAYGVGAFPTGYFLTLFFSKTDLRFAGSGTVGASNVARFLGPIGFLVVFLCDLAKAYGLLLCASFFFPSNWARLFLSVTLVLGNIFSFGSTYPRGKGVATALGALLFCDQQLFFVFVTTWIVTVLICQVPTCASLISLFVSLVVSYCLTSATDTKLFLIVLHPILFYTHRLMVQKILSHERVVWFLKQLRMRLPRLKR